MLVKSHLAQIMTSWLLQTELNSTDDFFKLSTPKALQNTPTLTGSWG